MNRYLIDTTTLIDFAKGREPTRSRLLAMIEAGDELAVCGVIVAEFASGIAPADRPLWEDFLSSLDYWQTTRAAAWQAGTARYALARRGIQVPVADCLIAAVAREHQAVIITDNVADYPFPGTRLLSLRTS